MRFLPAFATAAWMPHVEGAARWVWLGIFLGVLIWLLRGTEA